MATDELRCDRAKLTADQVLVRVDGVWIELLPARYRRMQAAVAAMEEILAAGGDVTADQKVEKIKEVVASVGRPDFTNE